jgi:hypothetical protein
MRTVFEKAPPDPRFADLIRRIQDAARRRFKNAPGSAESKAAIDDEIALDRELNDMVRGIAFLGADPPDHDPDD